jgi:hypothetical protein
LGRRSTPRESNAAVSVLSKTILQMFRIKKKKEVISGGKPQ